MTRHSFNIASSLLVVIEQFGHLLQAMFLCYILFILSCYFTSTTAVAFPNVTFVQPLIDPLDIDFWPKLSNLDCLER